MATVAFEIRRKVGQDEIVIRMQSQVEKGGEEIELRGFAQVAAKAVVEYVQNLAPAMPTSRPTGVEASNDDGAGQWVDVTELTVTKDRGKQYLKLFTDKYSKHGVVCWPEVFKRAGVESHEAALKFEGKDPGWKALIVEKNGKPVVNEVVIVPKT